MKKKSINKLEDRRKMNWSQAKWANPGLKPMGDWDNDGVKNQFDCRPMNRKMQHELTKKQREAALREIMDDEVEIEFWARKENSG